MFTLRTGLSATALALMAITATATAAAAQAQTTDFAPGTGFSVLHQTVDLPANDTWTSTPLQVRLPAAGTYAIDANVRGRLQGTAPLDTWITARLWNVTTRTAVPDSERLIYQDTSISELVSVNKPETIELQAQNDNTTGNPASIAQIYSDGYGYTSMRYLWVGP